jgi:hypothetical protein
MDQAGQCRASKVPLMQVSGAFGHPSISVTADVYGHLLAPSTATADPMTSAMNGLLFVG